MPSRSSWSVSIPRETYFADFYRARNVASRFDLSLQHLPLGTKYVVYQYFVPFLNADLDNDRLLGLPASRCGAAGVLAYEDVIQPP